MSVDEKIETGYKVVVFEIRSGEKIMELEIDDSAAESAHEIVEMLIKSHQKRKRRERLKLE